MLYLDYQLLLRPLWLCRICCINVNIAYLFQVLELRCRNPYSFSDILFVSRYSYWPLYYLVHLLYFLNFHYFIVYDSRIKCDLQHHNSWSSSLWINELIILILYYLALPKFLFSAQSFPSVQINPVSKCLNERTASLLSALRSKIHFTSDNQWLVPLSSATNMYDGR